MSTWVGIEINGFEVESFQNHHNIWFFRNNDRIRTVPPHYNGEDTQGVFIGYRASAATIRRRMTLAGYDMHACVSHFCEYLDKVISSAQAMINLLQDSFDRNGALGKLNERSAEEIVVYQKFINAIENSKLEDWILLFPQAIKRMSDEGRLYDPFNDAQWYKNSDDPLLCAMLSDVPLFSEYSNTGFFNFPGNDPNIFIMAFLSSCQDDAICELNIAELIWSGYEEDFGDLEEIQKGTTVPFRNFRQSVNEFQQISTLKPDDQVLQRMCFSSIITAMEAYIGDIMKREVLHNEAIKRRFVEKSGIFNEQKLRIEAVYNFLDGLDKRITKELDDTSFHNIQTARKMLTEVLLIEFPNDLVPKLNRAVIKRHDIVHRNGKSTNGQTIHVTSEHVIDLLELVVQCIENIDQQVLDALAKDNDESE
ncbi:HEPN/Toprim-associated domain-containing protein [Cronobacter dublinensis]|uniref:HEPN/Toprim-associated domain-containing protein n=1 Tax=Cronobacter dublinensis TaxID=413497 RepID=UPI000CFCBC4D|nr:HEPN/Toprim-associated domain-containing protein [Cronobacter dublinensis]